MQVGGGTAATTSYDAANRPTAGANPTAAYASDADGRLTARPGQTMTHDHLGRLTAVKDASGATTLATLATTAYDPLDRLRTVDDGGGNRIRFRYVGLTTAAAQWWDDIAGTVTRSIGNGWGGERLLDWTGTSGNRRYYGDNAHHDVTWLADATGAVSASLRYDPWGTPRSTPPSGYTPFRFQGSWSDQATDLAWVVTRWYAPSLGRFVSEDTLLGEPREPDSRHLYAYAAGEPVGAWDPDGRFWYKWKASDTLKTVATVWLADASRKWAIRNTNRNRLADQSATSFTVGKCIWVPRNLWVKSSKGDECTPSTKAITGNIESDSQTREAAKTWFGDWREWYTLSTAALVNFTILETGRSTNPSDGYSRYKDNERFGNNWARVYGQADAVWNTRVRFPAANITFVWGSWLPPDGYGAATFGHYVFMDESLSRNWVECCGLYLVSHEYIHVLQWQGLGRTFAERYIEHVIDGGTRQNLPEEAPGYFWESWMRYYSKYGEKPPWFWFAPLQ